MDSVTKTSKLVHAVKEPHRKLRQSQHTVVIQRKELVELIIVDNVAPASRPAACH